MVIKGEIVEDSYDIERKIIYATVQKSDVTTEE